MKGQGADRSRSQMGPGDLIKVPDRAGEADEGQTGGGGWGSDGVGALIWYSVPYLVPHPLSGTPS